VEFFSTMRRKRRTAASKAARSWSRSCASTSS